MKHDLVLVISLLVLSTISSSAQSKDVNTIDSQAFLKITSDAGGYFRQGLWDLQNNNPLHARENFDKSVEVFLGSAMNIQANQKVSSCYNQLIETVYRIEFPSDGALPNIKALSATCGWNIEITLVENVVKLVQARIIPKKPANNSPNQTNDLAAGFTEQKYEPSPIDEPAKLELVREEQQTPPTKPSLTSIRQVDFRNFTYTLTVEDQEELENASKTLTVRKGEYITEVKNGFYQGLYANKVIYGDITGDGVEDALVEISIMLYGGSPAAYEITRAYYIFTLRNGKTEFLTRLDVLSNYEKTKPGNVFLNYKWDGNKLVLAKKPIRRKTK